MKKNLLIVLALLIFTGTAVGAYLLGKNAQKPETLVNNAIPTAVIEPSPTTPPSISGKITGSISFPSEVIPDNVEVCAKNTLTDVEYCTKDRIESPKYTYGVGYILEVPVGSYLVYSQGEGDLYKAYYSEFVTCGLKATCLSHEPIAVSISAGQIVENVDPGDWYNIPADKPSYNQPSQ